MDTTSLSNRPLTDAGEYASEKIHSMIDSAKNAAASAESRLQDTLDNARDTLPGTFAKFGEKCDSYARRSMTRAADLRDTALDKAHTVEDQAVDYIKDQPLKAVLIAAAAGAGIALLINSFGRRS